MGITCSPLPQNNGKLTLPFFAVVMAIYHYVERIWIILVTPNFCITYTINNKYYPGEPVYIHIQPLLNIMQEKMR